MPTLLFRSMQVDSTIVMTESAKKPAEIVAGGTAGAANQEKAKPAAKLGNDPCMFTFVNMWRFHVWE